MVGEGSLRDFLSSLLPKEKAELADKALKALLKGGIDEVDQLREFSCEELLLCGVPPLLAKNMSKFFAQLNGDRSSYFESDAYHRLKNSTPSHLALDSAEFTLEHQMRKPPVFMNYRPDTAQGLPLPLISPVFANFLDSCQETEVRPQDSAFVYELCRESSKAYADEQQRRLMLFKLLKKYLDNKFVFEKTKSGIAISCGGWLLAFVAVRNEQGCGGDPFIQACRYYVDHLAANVDDEMLGRGCCPVFLLEVVGPLLRISGAAFTDGPVVEPLRMGLLLRRRNAGEMDSLCRMVVALRKSLEEALASISVQASKLDLAGAKLPYVLQELHLRGARVETITYGETYVVHVERLQHEVPEPPSSSMSAFARIQHLGVGKIFVKFCQRYGSEVHRDWFERGCAPELFDTISLGGGWLMVCMEYRENDIDLLKASETFQLQWGEIQALAHRCLDEAQLSDLQGVHGDLRLPNLMVDPQLSRVIAVDFGSAGRDGIDRYPYYMNHADIAWPDGASDGAVLRREHDQALLTSQLALGKKRKRSAERTQPGIQLLWD
ncbi:hypothetical protein SELMODRAFT_426530 [Selaginella moellendorffii]|uniref:Protein kinase domain-containing protein n=1 Tax=Selaginella moellendorffii TaxID=88036 RepID=D8SWN1_SELML|nr:uncharacterized protein LOC9651952 [Selaginella moellendorffii]EFJ11122.1 hypothetical protein SELMODRAFT_426530 [Selaginella moellendorffii]|eukprot:XP_002987819.1 uncharacterized protein LOC9651952 [Selaginella moellendorffii]